MTREDIVGTVVYHGKRIPTAVWIEVLPLPSEEISAAYLEGPLYAGPLFMHSYRICSSSPKWGPLPRVLPPHSSSSCPCPQICRSHSFFTFFLPLCPVHFFMACRQWCPCSRWHFQKLDPTCTNILNKIRKVLYSTWILVAFVSSPEMMYCTNFLTVQEDAEESIVRIVHSRGFSLVLSGSVLNVQKLVSLLNVTARNPLVLQM